MTRNGRETVYCRRCEQNMPVRTIVSQRRQPKHRVDVVLPDTARAVGGYMTCGHPFHCVITLDNVAIIREAM